MKIFCTTLCFCLLLGFISNAQVKIGLPAGPPQSSSILDLSNIGDGTKALSLPRVAKTDSIRFPVEGMLVYDSSAKTVKGYEKGAWVSYANPPTAAANVNCTSSQINGKYTHGGALTSSNTITIVVVNNSFSTVTITPTIGDIVFSGPAAGGMSVNDFQPAIVSPNPGGDSSTITYNLVGRPTTAGSFTVTWKKGLLTCVKTGTVDECPPVTDITISSSTSPTILPSFIDATDRLNFAATGGTSAAPTTLTWKMTSFPSTGVFSSADSGTSSNSTASLASNANGTIKILFKSLNNCGVFDTTSQTISINSLAINCAASTIDGAYTQGGLLDSTNTISIVVVNNSSTVLSYPPETNDIVLSGPAAAGMSVTSFLPVSISPNPGGTSTIVYKLTGTPTTNGSFTVTWTEGLTTCSKTGTVNVCPAVSPIAITNTTTPTILPVFIDSGSTINFAATGGTSTAPARSLTWKMTSTPSTGVFTNVDSGTTRNATAVLGANANGTVTVTFKAVNNCGVMQTQALPVTVNSLVINCGASTINGAYTQGGFLDSTNTISIVIVNNSSAALTFAPTLTDITLNGLAAAGMSVISFSPASAIIPASGGTRTIIYKLTGKPTTTGSFTATFKKGLTTCTTGAGIVNTCPTVSAITLSSTTTPAILPVFIDSGSTINYTASGGISSAPTDFTWKMTSTPSTGVFTNVDSGTTRNAMATLAGNANGIVTAIFKATNNCGVVQTQSLPVTVNSLAINCGTSAVSGAYTQGGLLDSTNFITIVVKNNSSSALSFTPATTDITLSGAAAAGMSATSVSPTSSSIAANGGTSSFIYKLTGKPTATGSFIATFTKGLTTCATPARTVNVCPAVSPIFITNSFTPTTLPVFIDSGSKINFAATGGTSTAPTNITWKMTSTPPTGVFSNVDSGINNNAVAILASNANGIITVAYKAANNCGVMQTQSLPVTINSLAINCAANAINGAYTQGGTLDSSNNISIAVVNNSSSALTFTGATTDIALNGAAAAGFSVTSVQPTSISIASGNTTIITYKLTGKPTTLGSFGAIFTKGLTTCTLAVKTVVICPTVSTVFVGNTTSPTTLPSFIDAGNTINFVATGGNSTAATIFTWKMTSPTGVFSNVDSGTTRNAMAVLATNANGTVTVAFTATNSCGAVQTKSQTKFANSLSVNCSTSTINGIYTQGGILDTASNTITYEIQNNSSVDLTFIPSIADITLSGPAAGGMTVTSVSPTSVTPNNGGGLETVVYRLSGKPTSAGSFIATFTKGLTTCATPAGTVNVCPAVSPITVSSTTTPATLPAFIDATNRINFVSAGGTSTAPTNITWKMTSTPSTGMFTNVDSGNTANATAVLAANANGIVTVAFKAINNCGVMQTQSLPVTVNSLIVNCGASVINGVYTQGGVLDPNTNSVTVVMVNNSSTPITFTPATTDIALSGTANAGITVNSVSPTSVTVPAGGNNAVTYKLTGTPTATGTLIATFTKGLTTCATPAKTVNVCATVSDIVVSNTTTPATLPVFIDAGNAINFTTTGGSSSAPVNFSWTVSSLPAGIITGTTTGTTSNATAVLTNNANGTVKVLFTATNNCGVNDTTSRIVSINSLTVNCGTSIINGIYTQGGVLDATNTVTIVVTNNSTAPLSFTPVTGDIVLNGVAGMSVASVSAGSVIPAGGTSNVIYTLSGSPATSGTFTATFTKGLTTCTSPAKTVNVCPVVTDIVVSNSTTPATLPAIIVANNSINFTTTGGTSSAPNASFTWTMTSLPAGIITGTTTGTTSNATAVLADNANGTVKVLYTATNNCGVKDTTSKTVIVNSLAVNCGTSTINGSYTYGVALDGTNTVSIIVANNGSTPLTFTPAPTDIALSGVAGMTVSTASSATVTPAGGTTTIIYTLTGKPASAGTLTVIWTGGSLNCVKSITVNPCPVVSDLVVSNTTTPASLPVFIDAGNTINFTTTGGGISTATPVNLTWTMTSNPAGIITGTTTGTTSNATAVLANNANGTVKVLYTATNNCGVSDTTSRTVTVNSLAVNCGTSIINGAYTYGVALDGSNTITFVVTNNSTAPLSFTPATGDIVLNGVAGMSVASVSAGSVITAGGTNNAVYTLSGSPTASGTFTATFTKGLTTCTTPAKTVNVCPVVTDVVVSNTTTPATLPAIIVAGNAINFTTTGGTSAATPVNFAWTMTSSPANIITGTATGTTSNATAVLANNASGTVTVLFTATNNCGVKDTTSRTVIVNSLAVNCAPSTINGTYTYGVALDGTNTISIVVANSGSTPLTFTPATTDIALSGVAGMTVSSTSSAAVTAAGGTTTIVYTLTGKPTSAGTLTALWAGGALSCTKNIVVNPCPVVSDIVVSNTTTPTPLPAIIVAGNAINFTASGGGISTATPVILTWTMTSNPAGLFTSTTGSAANATANLAANALGTVTVLFTGTNNCGVTDTTSKTVVVNSLAVNCVPSTINGVYTKDVVLDGTNTISIVLANNGSTPLTFTPSTTDIVLSGITGTMAVSTVSAPTVTPAGGTSTITYNLTGTPSASGILTATWTGGSLSCIKTVTVSNCPVVSDVVVSNTTTPATLPVFIDATSTINFTTSGGISAANPVNFAWTMTSSPSTGVFTNSSSSTGNAPSATANLAANANGTVTVLFTATNNCGVKDTTSRTVTINSLTVDCASSLINGTYTQGVPLDATNYITYVITNNSTTPLSFTPAIGDISLSGSSTGITVNSVTTSLATIPAGGTSTVTYKLIGTPSTPGTFTATFTKGLTICTTPVAKTVNPCPTVTDIVVSNTTTPATLPVFIDASSRINFTTTGGTSTATIASFTWAMTSAPVGLFTNAASGTANNTTAVLAANANGTVKVLFTATNSCGSYDTTSRTVTVNSLTVNCATSVVNGTYISNTTLNSSNNVTMVITNANSTALSFTPATTDVALSGSYGGMSVSTVSPTSVTVPANSSTTVTYYFTGTPASGGTFTATFTRGLTTCAKNGYISCPNITAVTITSNSSGVASPTAQGNTVNFSANGGDAATYKNYTITSDKPGILYPTDVIYGSGNVAQATLNANVNGTITINWSYSNTCGQVVNATPLSVNIDDQIRRAIATAGCTSCAAYDAAQDNQWVNITLNEFTSIRNNVGVYYVGGCSDGLMGQTPYDGNFGYRTVSPVGQETYAVPANHYVVLFSAVCNSAFNSYAWIFYSANQSTGFGSNYNQLNTSSANVGVTIYNVMKRPSAPISNNPSYVALLIKDNWVRGSKGNPTVNSGISGQYDGNAQDLLLSVPYAPLFQLRTTATRKW